MIAFAGMGLAFIWTTGMIILAVVMAAAAAASAGLAIAQAAGAFDVAPPDIEDAEAIGRAARQRNIRRQQAAFGFQDTVNVPLGGSKVSTGTAVTNVAPPVPRAGPGE